MATSYEIIRVRERQLAAAQEYEETGEELALLGASDWLHEELLIEKEERLKENGRS